MPSPRPGYHCSACRLHHEVDEAEVRQAADAGIVRRRHPAWPRIAARPPLVEAARVDLALRHQFAGGEVDQPRLDAALEDGRTCCSEMSAPASARPAATSTFFSMYSRALAACRGCRLTAVTDH